VGINASALPTCPGLKQQTQHLIDAESRNKRSLTERMPQKQFKPSTDFAGEAFLFGTIAQ
jgi:hypothetical protein